MKKADIYKIVREYSLGKLDKYEAMNALNLDSVSELLHACAQHQIIDTLPDSHQTDIQGPALESFLTHE